MSIIEIGKTGLRVEQNGFGALPIQRISKENAVYLLQKALSGGMTFFDTARGYTDSEEKLGQAFYGIRNKVVIASKARADTAEDLLTQIESSLRALRTDYIDLYQFHNPPFCPKPGDKSGLYDAMLEAKKRGQIRFIGITSHRLDVANDAILSGFYDTLQFPFNYLSQNQEIELVQKCHEQNMGFIAMKPLSGGLITHSAAACAWIRQFKPIVPIWGIQRESELNEFLSHITDPPQLSPELISVISADRQELVGDFCRGCGYCMPCPQGIEISTCARASLLLRRSPPDDLLSEEGQKMMKKIENCTECRQCVEKCPYELDTPALLKRNYQDYLEILAGKVM